MSTLDKREAVARPQHRQQRPHPTRHAVGQTRRVNRKVEQLGDGTVSSGCTHRSKGSQIRMDHPAGTRHDPRISNRLEEHSPGTLNLHVVQ